MKKKFDFKSEDGAAEVLEAVIIYPIVLVAVIFLILWGFTYVQRGYLQYASSQLSGYLSKVAAYPGYDMIEVPFYKTQDKTQLDAVNSAMKVHNPYRYFFGLDKNMKEITEACRTNMADDFIQNRGFLKANEGEVPVPSDFTGSAYQSKGKKGYVCAINTKTGFARVYIAQNYIFADFFSLIGLGGRKMTLYGDSLQYLGDSVEVVRVTDFACDTINYVLESTGIKGKIDKIQDTIKWLQGES